MAVKVKFNNDLEFRKEAAFARIYASADPRRRSKIELIIAGVCVVIAAAMWVFGSKISFSLQALYISAVFAVSFFGRYIRALRVRHRTKHIPDASRDIREFDFDSVGFNFGPLDENGRMVQTKWRDVDKVYIGKGVIYILCQGRTNWATIDTSKIIEGTYEELCEIIKTSLPKARISERKNK